MTEEELVRKAQLLDRYETMAIKDENGKHLLSCTPQGFSDECEVGIQMFLDTMAKRFNVDDSKKRCPTEIDMDKLAEVRDSFIELLCSTFEFDVIYGYTEY